MTNARRKVAALATAVALAGALGAQVATAPTAAAEPGVRHCNGHVCLTVTEGSEGKLGIVDITGPSSHKKSLAYWSYRQPGGSKHVSRHRHVHKVAGGVEAYWQPNKKVHKGTTVCGHLGRTMACVKL